MLPKKSVRHEEISIHALREEGDVLLKVPFYLLYKFLSTPSARRATPFSVCCCFCRIISIHALREEGDRGRQQTL